MEEETIFIPAWILWTWLVGFLAAWPIFTRSMFNELVVGKPDEMDYAFSAGVGILAAFVWPAVIPIGLSYVIGKMFCDAKLPFTVKWK